MRAGAWVILLLLLSAACGRTELLELDLPAPAAQDRDPPPPSSADDRRPPDPMRPDPARPAATAGVGAAPTAGTSGDTAPKPPPDTMRPPKGPEPGPGMTRWILAGEVENARDLGGVTLGPGQWVTYGALFRGPPLADLSPDGCKQVESLGIRTVIDLRTPSERDSRPQSECVARGTRLVLAPLPVPYDVSPEAYLKDLYTTDSIATVFATLSDPSAYPIYFHCTYGRDRTAVVAAVILLALGAAPHEIMDEYLLSSASVGAYPESLKAVLEEVEGAGGIEAFLARAGIPPQQLATLRKSAVSGP